MISTLPIRVNTVVIRKQPNGNVVVMMFTDMGYVPALNPTEVAPLAMEVVKDRPAGDYDCPLDLAARSLF